MRRTEPPWSDWLLSPAAYPSEVYSSISRATEADAGVGDTLLERLMTLVDDGLEVAVVAAWHPHDAPRPGGLTALDHVPDGEPGRRLDLARPHPASGVP